MSTKSDPQSNLWTLGANYVSLEVHRLEQKSRLVGVCVWGGLWGACGRRGVEGSSLYFLLSLPWAQSCSKIIKNKHFNKHSSGLTTRLLPLAIPCSVRPRELDLDHTFGPLFYYYST